MPNRLILKVTKFQSPPPKRLGTVVKNIFFGGAMMAPPMSNRVNSFGGQNVLQNGNFCPYFENSRK